MGSIYIFHIKKKTLSQIDNLNSNIKKATKNEDRRKLQSKLVVHNALSKKTKTKMLPINYKNNNKYGIKWGWIVN